MKKGLVVFSLFLMLLSLTGCLDESESMKLAVCGSHAVPGMFCWELKGETFSCDVVERDSVGRILFLYKSRNAIIDQRAQAYVVCQKIDSSFVYFYEDISYLNGMPSDEELDQLKEANNWDQPYTSDGVSRRKHIISFDLFIMPEADLDYSDLVDACCEILDIQEKDIYELTLMDVNESKQELYWLSTETDGEKKGYFLMADPDYSVSYAEYSGDVYNELPAFKQGSNWVYP